MKKTVFLAIMLAAIFTSCSNSELTKAGAVSTATSASIVAYVADNYPGTTIFTTTVSGSTVTATLNTGEQVTFDKAGAVKSYTNEYSLAYKADSLNSMYDSIPHGGMGGNMGGGHGHGGPGGKGGCSGYNGPGGPGYGGPILDSTQVAGFGKPGHDRHYNNEIAVDSLPSVILAYMSTNYAGYAVIHAEIDTLCQGIVTEVMVCTKTAEPVKLVFDAAGTYLFKAERILYADVPAAVSAAITANYATYKVTRRVEKLTLADGNLQFKVFLILVKVHKAITFNSDGSVVCEK